MRATRNTVGMLADEPIPERIQDELLKAFRDWRATGS